MLHTYCGKLTIIKLFYIKHPVIYYFSYSFSFYHIFDLSILLQNMKLAGGLFQSVGAIYFNNQIVQYGVDNLKKQNVKEIYKCLDKPLRKWKDSPPEKLPP